jgi:flagellar hook-basal body complex protein FliE
MTQPISPFSASPIVSAALSAEGGSRTSAMSGGASFKDLLLGSIEKVNSMQQDANLAVEELAAGGNVGPAEVFTAVRKADLAFRMMMQIHNELLQVFQEVQNIRV